MDRNTEIGMIKNMAVERQTESDPEPYVLFENVRKVYHVGEVDIEALADASFSVCKGELAVVVGESGAGKTTLLNILGGMDTLTRILLRLKMFLLPHRYAEIRSIPKRRCKQ